MITCLIWRSSLSPTREYLDNVVLVDSGVAEIVSVLEEFFGNDGRTAYVFTADHGMTNWGKVPLFVFRLPEEPGQLYKISDVTWQH